MRISKRRMLRSVHFAGIVWFVVCAAYVLVLALRQAGFRWWVIFSLSGHSALLIFLLVSLYLFAVFRGAGRSQNIEVEHALSSTDYYKVFYVVAPFLGGVAGSLATIGTGQTGQHVLAIALGTLVTTFLVWVVVDPATGLVEMLLPASRKHRAQRLCEAKALREKKQKDRERLLTELLAKEESQWRQWQEILTPKAQKLAALLATDEMHFEEAQRQAVDLGVSAWQIGGLSCMQQLRRMAIEIHEKTCRGSMVIDYISTWWDGIGSWRSPSFAGSV